MFVPTAILVLLIAIYGDASEQTGSFTNGLYYKKVGSSWFYGKGEKYNPDDFAKAKHIKMITVDVTKDKEQSVPEYLEEEYFREYYKNKIIVGAKIYTRDFRGVIDTPNNPVVDMQMSDKKINIKFDPNSSVKTYCVDIYYVQV